MTVASESGWHFIVPGPSNFNWLASFSVHISRPFGSSLRIMTASTGLFPSLLPGMEEMRLAALGVAGYGPLPVLPFILSLAVPAQACSVLSAFVCQSKVKGTTWHHEHPVLDLEL